MELWAKFALILINVILNFRRVIPILITTAVFVSVIVCHPFSKVNSLAHHFIMVAINPLALEMDT